jgi:aldehyde dehydrogenase (NAD+)
MDTLLLRTVGSTRHVQRIDHLGGTVWTRDVERGLDVARRVESGTIGVNTYLPDPVAPFGGVKGSGLGRELGPEGLANYQELKTIYIPGPA